MPFKDHYKTLELSPQATTLEIKKAYRILARKYHPDLNANTAQATIYFQEIQAAYEVLSDSTKRRTYDNELKQAGQYVFNSKENNLNSSAQILKQAKDVRNYVQNLDQRVVNNDALIDFVLAVLSQENMDLLVRADNKENNFQIADNLLNACKGVVATRLFRQLTDKLFILHPDTASPMNQRISLELSLRHNKEYQNRLVPYAAFAVILIIIVVMMVIIF